jgi:hypothetical protein
MERPRWAPPPRARREPFLFDQGMCAGWRATCCGTAGHNLIPCVVGPSQSVQVLIVKNAAKGYGRASML